MYLSSIFEPVADADTFPLGTQELLALNEACGPVSILALPSADIVRSLRKQGYIVLVVGGIQITPLGLERLLWERSQSKSDREQLAVEAN